jgi:uncharacterized protein YfiM (DUF2279 family)
MRKLIIGVLLSTLPMFALDWHFAKPKNDHWFAGDKLGHFTGSFFVSSAWYWDETLHYPNRPMDKTKAHLMSLGGTMGIGLVKEIVDGFHYHEAGTDGFSYKDLIYDAAGAVIGSYAVDLLSQHRFIGPYQGFQVIPWKDEPWDMTHVEEGAFSCGLSIMLYNSLRNGRFASWEKTKAEVVALGGVLLGTMTLEILNGCNMFPAGNKFSPKDCVGKLAGLGVGFLVIHFLGAPWVK